MSDIESIPPIRAGRAPYLLPVALALSAIAINLPFLDQAFHMDDGIYLMLGRNFHNHPFFPQDMHVLFEGLSGEDLASTEHPWPITAYLMALCARIGGTSEICMHLGFLAFPVILAISMYSLARRYTCRPALASLTLLCMPAVYVLSHTVMTDIPQLSLWLASLALFSRGVCSGRTSSAWIGAAVSAVAGLLSYSGWCLVVLTAIFAMLHRNRRAAIAALTVPALVFSIWIVITYIHYHRVTPGLLISAYLFAKRVLAPQLLVQKAGSAILILGGVTLSPFLFLAIARKKALMAGILMTCLSAPILAGSIPGTLQKALLALFLAAGFSAVIEAALAAIAALGRFKGNWHQAVPDLFLGIWFFGMLFLPVFVCMTGSARYFLLALPPLTLIIFRRLEACVEGKKAFAAAAANLVLSGSLAVSLAIADYQFAGIYREFASSLKASWDSPGTGLWFAGEWGLRTYLEQLGGQELGRRDARPRAGDLLVVPQLATPYQTLFSDTLALDSISMVAPSRLAFSIPALPAGCSLINTIGMPYYSKSDGLDFTVQFQSSEGRLTLHHERLLPGGGRRWQVREISLGAIAGEAGSIVFSADVGETGNADADWLSLARARISRKDAKGETVLYDFQEHIELARIESVPGARYHTEGNQPVLCMRTWLEQEPPVTLQSRHEYSPTFPLRVLDERSGAGFWGSSWGLLPFSFPLPGLPLETISVYKITRPVDSYGEVTPSWYQP